MKDFVGKNVSKLCAIAVIFAGLAAGASMPFFAARAGLRIRSATVMVEGIEKALDRPAPRMAAPHVERNWSAVRNVFKIPSPERMPELVGIWGSTALFADEKGQVIAYEPGDMVGSYRLVSVGNMQAVLMGEQGEIPVPLAGYRPPPGWKPPKGAPGSAASATQPGMPAMAPSSQTGPALSVDENEMRRRMRDFARQRLGGLMIPGGPGN